MSVRARFDAHLESRDVARVIYGAIVGLAGGVALQDHPPPAAASAAILVGTAIAVGLAELYGEYVSAEIRGRGSVPAHELVHLAGEAAAVFFGASFPAFFLVLAAAGAMDVSTAFELAKWTGATVIVGYGYVAARLSGLGSGRALVHAAVLGAVGFALIGLKALVH